MATERYGSQQPHRAVESASASTAPQENDSNFAYILVAGALGLYALIAVAVCMLIYIAFGAVWGAQDMLQDATYFEYELDEEQLATEARTRLPKPIESIYA